jgi:hypothetical protein
MKILSIDPGKSGAIVLSNYENGLSNVTIESFSMPVLKNKDYDIRRIAQIFLMDYDIIGVEDVHSIQGTSAKSNFQFGFGVGIINGMAEISMKPFIKVPPKTWQAISWGDIKRVKDPKINSFTAVHRLFPNINLKASERSKNAHEGIIDAILIGYYIWMKFYEKR